jgi:UDP-N-acetylglucosamine--N-acetylmuramyl-(pentapeptide) pyrophosphoryl-undecaprenol N-acetylglucosamine transferase
MSQPEHKIVISGGGTGGHIFPAIAIAMALERKLEGVEFLFIGARGRMEMEKVPAAGYEIVGLWISGLSRKLSADNLAFPFKLTHSILKARKILKRFRPDAVVGVGGFASGPTLIAASRLGIPTLIQEQNAYPGITNKWLSKSVDRICVANERMNRFFPSEKIVLTGNPIRKEVVDIAGKRERAAQFFHLRPNVKTVLVVGGSQGARAVNLAITGMLDYFADNGIQLLWQTGKHFIDEARSALKEKHLDLIHPVDFIYDMDLAYALSDVIISRAGAIAIAEISAIARPAIFIPLPTAAEDHQTKNAMALVDKGAAMMVRNDKANEELKMTLDSLLRDDQKQEKMSTAIRKLANINADDHIAEEVINLIKQNRDGNR